MVGCESVRPQRAAMGLGSPRVSVAPRPAENFLEEMLDVTE